MRRVVSQVPSAPKTTWFSCMPSCISSAPVAMRAELLQRAGRDDRLEVGERAGDGRLLDGEPVRVGRGHHDLARLEAHENAREHRPALVTRRAPSDPRDRLDERVAVDRVQRADVDLGQTREVLARVGVQPVGRSARRDDHHRLVGMVLERDLAVRQRPGDVEQQPAGNDDRSFVGDLRVDRRSQRDLHVGRGEVQLASFGPQLNPAEHEHRRAARDTTCDDGELGRELVLGDGNPQSGAHHCF